VQCTLHQIHGTLCGRQTAPFIPVSVERGINRVRRGMLGEFGADGPVSVTSPFNTAMDEMMCDRREDDGMPAHHLVRRYSGVRSRSHVTAVASHPSVPGGCTCSGQPDGTFRAITPAYQGTSNEDSTEVGIAHADT
jgi:hypothetical protein